MLEHDQATGLRRIFGRDALQIMSISGGNRAPTAVTLNLAAALASLGHRVLVLDLAKGEAALALGLKSRYELAHVLDGDKPIRDVLLESREGISVLPACRGMARLSGGAVSWRQALHGALPAAPRFNVWLVNGVAPPLDELMRPPMVIALTREAIIQACALIKSLARSQGQREFRVVIDRAESEETAKAAFASLAEASHRFLSARLDYCGFLPRDDAPADRSAIRSLAGLTDARSPRGHAYARLAEAVAAAIPVDLTSFALA